MSPYMEGGPAVPPRQTTPGTPATAAHDHQSGDRCTADECVRHDFYRDLRRMDMTRPPPSAEYVASGIEAVWLDGWTVGVRAAARASALSEPTSASQTQVPITVEAPRLFSEVANDPDEWHHIGSCPYCAADHDEPEARFMNGNKVLRLLAALSASEAG